MKNGIQVPAVNTLRWFECDGLYMAIERSASVALHQLGLADSDILEVADLADMVLLEELNGLLTCLDECAGMEFDWRPLPVADNTDVASGSAREEIVGLHELQGYPRLTASLSTLQGDGCRLLLSMDMPTLNAMLPLPDEWQSLVIFTNYIRPMRLQLQSMTISNQEHCKLAPGAMVLIPASFDTQWQCALLGEGDAVTSTQPAIEVILDVAESSVRLLPPSNTQATRTPYHRETHLISIEVEELLHINELYTQSVWQWRQNMVITLPQPLLGSRVVLRMGERPDAQTLDNPCTSTEKPDLSGTLIEVGKGYGVLLEQQA